jgi:hypothetical protein
VPVSGYADGQSLTTVQLGYSLAVKIKSEISTMTKSKSIKIDEFAVRSSSALYAEQYNVFWNDTTTAWTSLGTLTFPFAQNVTIIIKRIL